MNAIELKNVTFGYYKNKPIINDLSLSIEAGKFISIIGHNGSGKSTVAKLIMGLVNPFSGQILINEQALDSRSVGKLRNQMAMVFQNPDNQFIGATVEDDIAFGLENRQIDRDKMHQQVDEYLKKVGMLEYREKEPSALSGGQKQRVAIAGALALGPDILILDEATAMLDPRGKRSIDDLIFQMKKENPNLTVINITHDIEETLNSDLIYVMSNGTLILKASPEELFNNESVLKEHHISTPFIFSFKQELKRNGINANADSINGIVEELWQLK